MPAKKEPDVEVEGMSETAKMAVGFALLPFGLAILLSIFYVPQMWGSALLQLTLPFAFPLLGVALIVVAYQVWQGRARTEGFAELIDKYVHPGPYEVLPADLIPRKDFFEWKATHQSAFEPVPEDVDTSKFGVPDWAEYLRDPAHRDALLDYQPFGFKDALRFRSQFVVGEPGTGKTTYMSRQIKDDLDRVIKGECCLFVMESKNELVPNIAKLAVFGPGGALEGKLVYIEPHEALALNIFEPNLKLSGNARTRANSEALQLINFFLGSIVKMDASSHQEVLLKYLLPAALACPNTTIGTLLELLTPDGYMRLRPHFKHLRQGKWLDDNLWSKEKRTTASSPGSIGITRDALRFRIDGILADDIFFNLFSKPRSSINLYDLLQEPRVILVNTVKGDLGDATAAFGTYFLAKLMLIAQERTLDQHSNKLPVMCHVDEASDYLKDNPAVVELMNKARAQNISFTFAVQGVEDVSPTVLAALRRAAVHAFNGTGEGGTWDLSIEKRPAFTVRVPPFHFSMEPQRAKKAKAAPRPRAQRPPPPPPPPPPQDDVIDVEFEEVKPKPGKPSVRLIPRPDSDNPSSD